MTTPHKLTVVIDAVNASLLTCRVSNEQESLVLLYHRDDMRIEYGDGGALPALIETFSFQFHKVIQSALNRKCRPGQTMACVFLEDFPFLSDRDYDRYITMDRRDKGFSLSLEDTRWDQVSRVFADGSFFEEINRSAYGGFVEDPRGAREPFCRAFSGGSGNLMELMGVADGLERLKESGEIQVNTDSRFVIRGLIQWVHFWRHNNWQTAYGRPVKYAREWQNIDRLCEDKRIQFKWIKGHSGHDDQGFCHHLARETAAAP